MKHSTFAPQRLLALGLVLLQFVSGCAFLPKRPAADTKDRDFTHYWAAPEGAGLRLAVKDLIDMKGFVTTAGSRYLAENAPPATKDAKCLAIARQRGVYIVGRTNVTEFAVTVSGVNDYFGTPRNRLTRHGRLIPGGSSSGSAVAVASHKADVSFGTDTAGSIRVPAACCGVIGLKTTYGLVPLDGVYPISPKHLDTVGPLARNVADTVKGMDLLQAGFAGRYQGAVGSHPSAAGITVGRLYVPGTSQEVDQAIDDALARSGFRVVPLSDEFRKEWEQAEKDGRTIAVGDAWNTDQYAASKPGVSSITKAVLTLGKIEYATNYDNAVQRKRHWQRVLEQTFRRVDLIALPTLKGLPPKVPTFGISAAFEARVFAMQNTVAVNYAGNPALAIPVPVDDKRIHLTSLQFIGPRRSEAQLLNAGRLVEKAVGTRDQYVAQR
jgi:Asp-tRNA(Asn)/Glu-tRNA(Gln) amidotransferase A subunit family amidase